MKRVSQAKTKTTEHGVVPEGDGWFIVNASDARWYRNDKFGTMTAFEGEEKFPQLGINIRVVQPGHPICHYHAEGDQEDFLVLKGECRVILEGEEYPLKTWDFIHCPAGTRHVFVGAGSEPCAILCVGSRSSKELIYPLDEKAKRYNATAPKETSLGKESYADSPKWEPTRGRWPI